MLGRAFALWAVYRCVFRGGFPGLMIGDGVFDNTAALQHRFDRMRPGDVMGLQDGTYVLGEPVCWGGANFVGSVAFHSLEES